MGRCWSGRFVVAPLTAAACALDSQVKMGDSVAETKAVDIAAAPERTFIVTTDGKLWACGAVRARTVAAWLRTQLAVPLVEACEPVCMFGRCA